MAGGRIPLARAIESASAELRKMTKEEVRSLEGEKDVDCSEQEEKKKKPEGEEPDPPPLCTLDLDSLRYACPPQSDLVPQYSFKLWVRIENCYLLNHSSEDDRYFIFFFKFAKINADLKVETLIGSQILLLDILLKLPNSYCLNFFCFNW